MNNMYQLMNVQPGNMYQLINVQPANINQLMNVYRLSYNSDQIIGVTTQTKWSVIKKVAECYHLQLRPDWSVNFQVYQLG